ncbi:MAG: DUF5320 domain-containing protein [Bacteroidales bacterium]|nr:DUF5320 domain-containing protein [Bacteroidales bacterium]
MMPRGDRTGPAGAGPMTGRRLGFCLGNDQAGTFYGQAYGYGRGPGMGSRHGFMGRFNRGNAWGSIPAPDYETNSPNEGKYLEREIEDLKEHLSFLEDRLSKIRK